MAEHGSVYVVQKTLADEYFKLPCVAMWGEHRVLCDCAAGKALQSLPSALAFQGVQFLASCTARAWIALMKSQSRVCGCKDLQFLYSQSFAQFELCRHQQLSIWHSYSCALYLYHTS